MSKYDKLNAAVTSRIIRAFRASSSSDRENGETWYPRANAWCAQLATEYSTTLETVAGVCAVLSPGSEWSRNQSATIQALVAHSNGDALPAWLSVYGYGAINKAYRILNGADPLDVLSGPKVCAFYDCILRPTESRAVVVDRHARCLALGLARSTKNGNVKSENEFIWLSRHYANAANRLGVLPATVQAVVWVHWRNTAIMERYS